MQTLNPKWTLLKPFQLPLQNVQCYIHYRDILQAASTVPSLIREDCSDFSSQYRCTQPAEITLLQWLQRAWCLQLLPPELRGKETNPETPNKMDKTPEFYPGFSTDSPASLCIHLNSASSSSWAVQVPVVNPLAQAEHS